MKSDNPYGFSERLFNGSGAGTQNFSNNILLSLNYKIAFHEDSPSLNHTNHEEYCKSMKWTAEEFVTCEKPTELTCFLNCDSEICSSGNENTGVIERDSLNSGQLVYIVVFMILSWMGQTTVMSLSDTITLQILGEENENKFGQTRLFGAIGWGLFSIIVGEAMDLANAGNSENELDFSVCFYLMLIFFIIDIICISFIKPKVFKKTKYKRIYGEVIRALTSPRAFVFAVSCLIIGIFSGITWTFLVLFLVELNTNKLLLGLIYAVESLGGELLVFLLSGWLLKRLGYVHSMTVVFLAFCIRFLGYSFVQSPVYVLPIELTEGFCCGLFYPLLSIYASKLVDENKEATMQGVLGGLFEGVGMGTGNFIGGLLYDHYGVHKLWRILGVAAGVCAVLHFIIHVVLDRTLPDTEEHDRSKKSYEEVSMKPDEEHSTGKS
jgi:MFS family permease